MSPEQARGKAVDGRSDLFSLGCVLYQACTGQLPFEGTDTISTLMAVSTDEPPSPEELNPEIPPALSDLVMQLLAKNPADRPPSARAVVEAVSRIEEDRLEPLPERSGRRPSRRDRMEDEDEDDPEDRRADVRTQARKQVDGPAIALIVLGVIGILMGVLYVAMGILAGLLAADGGGGPGAPNAPAQAMLIYGVMGVLFVVYNSVIIAGAVKMKNLKSFGFAMTASIMAIVPCGSCWIVGLPVGIWALVVLNRPGVRDSFR
jgi:hypothetical protein